MRYRRPITQTPKWKDAQDNRMRNGIAVVSDVLARSEYPLTAYGIAEETRWAPNACYVILLTGVKRGQFVYGEPISISGKKGRKTIYKTFTLAQQS